MPDLKACREDTNRLPENSIYQMFLLKNVRQQMSVQLTRDLDTCRHTDVWGHTSHPSQGQLWPCSSLQLHIAQKAFPPFHFLKNTIQQPGLRWGSTQNGHVSYKYQRSPVTEDIALGLVHVCFYTG